jgi:hypothetical protein
MAAEHPRVSRGGWTLERSTALDAVASTRPSGDR